MLALGAIQTTLANPSPSRAHRSSSPSTPSNTINHNQFHKDWDELLKTYTSPVGPVTKVDYKEWKKHPEKLNRYLASLSEIKKRQFESWNKNQQLAFLYNAYNAFTIKLILDHYPIASIKKIGGWFSSPWKISFFSLLGEKTNLDTIEHQMVRKNYHEPRSHFALNCASIGCPQLRGEAYLPTKLEPQLQEQALLFLNDSSRNFVDLKNNKLKLSKIFDWFKIDFGGSDKDVILFVAPYIHILKPPPQDLDFWKLDFFEYNWALNEK